MKNLHMFISLSQFFGFEETLTVMKAKLTGVMGVELD